MAINIEKELNQKYSHPSNYETEAVFVDFIILSFPLWRSREVPFKPRIFESQIYT